MKKFNMVFLSFWMFFSLPFLWIEINSFEKVDTFSNVFSDTKTNENNHYMIDYDTGDSVTNLGNDLEGGVIEDATGQYLYIDSSWVTFNLKEGYTVDDFKALEQSAFLTVYDVTNKTYDPVYVKELESGYGKDIFWESWDAWDDVVVLNFYVDDPVILEDFEMEEFHNYQIGFNVIQGDDLNAYSDVYALAVPQLSTFSNSATEDSITIGYEFTSPSSEIDFDFKEVYLEIEGERIELDPSPQGEYTITGLNPATQYSINFGYEATKILSTSNKYPISTEYELHLSTKMPANYKADTAIAILLILLLILVIILLILILVILLWWYQRRKIKELALVFDNSENINDDGTSTLKSTGFEHINVESTIEVKDSGVNGYSNNINEDIEESGIHDYENPHEDFDDMEVF